MVDNGRLTVVQKVKVVLFYTETKGVVASQRRFSAHFGTRWAPCKQTIYRLSLATVFQPMRINSVPDVKCFCNNKNVLCVQSMVWHFVRHPVYIYTHKYKTKSLYHFFPLSTWTVQGSTIFPLRDIQSLISTFVLETRWNLQSHNCISISYVQQIIL